MEPLQYNLAGHPEIFIVSNVEEGGKALGMKRAGWGWHSDGEDKAIPNAGSFLHALELPPEGGDTLFADMYGAFEALPGDVRATIAGRRACFSRVRLHHVHYPHLPALTDEDKRKRPDVWHPIARQHPKSGWTALYIGRWACEIEEMSGPDGSALIQYLQEFAVRQCDALHRMKVVPAWSIDEEAVVRSRRQDGAAVPRGFDDHFPPGLA